MKHKIVITLSAISMMVACSHNPHKAEKIETNLEQKQSLNGDTNLGIKEGQMVVQKKVLMNEELRRLQYEVYGMEDLVYGNRKYGSLGLYGVLRSCRAEASDPKNGGDGKLIWTEPMDRVTDKEDDFKIGIDEQQKLIGVTEEFLVDRINRFKGYKQILQKRQDEYEEKVEICKAQLKAKKFEASKQ